MYSNLAVSLDGVVFNHDGSDTAHHAAVLTGNYPYARLEIGDSQAMVRIALEAQHRITSGENPDAVCKIIWHDGDAIGLSQSITEEELAAMAWEESYQSLREWAEE